MSTSYALFKSKFKKTITESIYNEVTTKHARYYHFLGKENTWTDFLSPFIPSSPTDLPGEPQDNFRYDLHVRRDILSVKLITPSDVSYVVPRYDWIRNTVYDMYDDNIGPVSISGTTEPAPSGAIRLEDAKFYVLTTEFNVYKCINNNYNSKSTVQPSGTSTNTFTTSDGYIWKFMYTIPISLRNRFLSSEYMPVTTALKQQFYSNGAITSVTIENGGSGYLAEIVGAGTISTTSGSNAVVGYLTSFNVQVKSGYILKTLSGTIIGTVAVVNSNTSITLQANAAVVITSGAPESFRVTPPVAASVVVTGNGYLGKNPYVISGITGFPSGIGYSVAPNITFSAPKIISGLQVTATGTATVSGGAINLATLQTAGYGYDGAPNAPTILVDPPMGASTGYAYWAASTVYTQNTILQHGRRFYRVSNTGGGTSGTTGPTHTTGAVANGTATLTFVGPSVWSSNISYPQYTILTSGSNYYTVTNVGGGTSGPNAPTGVVEGGSETNGGCTMVYFGRQASLAASVIKTEADLTPIITNGEVTGIIINDGGVGYDDANIQIVDTNHPATPVVGTESTYAVIKPNFSIGNVDTLQANVELMAVKGTIEVIKVVDGGSGYGSATVKIIGDGTGATASTTPVGGRITKINVLNKGSGYTWTDVVITGTGTGAVARAVMSPLRGHGADAIDELNANSLIFYSSFSRVKNQGLLINNDYRKAGLLRNLNAYNSTQRFDLDVGSGCILVTGKFDVTKLAYDQLLVKKELDGNNYKQYRIVEFNSTQILISVFNNFNVNPNDELLTPDGSVISVTSVVQRTIDQMSGDLLFLTVRDAFQPTQEQIITLRTVVTV
jgi:hypothetical protein